MPSGDVKVKPRYGLSSPLLSIQGLAEKTNSACEPSSNVPCKYHHSKVPRIGLIRIPFSHGCTVDARPACAMNAFESPKITLPFSVPASLEAEASINTEMFTNPDTIL